MIRNSRGIRILSNGINARHNGGRKCEGIGSCAREQTILPDCVEHKTGINICRQLFDNRQNGIEHFISFFFSLEKPSVSSFERFYPTRLLFARYCMMSIVLTFSVFLSLSLAVRVRLSLCWARFMCSRCAVYSFAASWLTLSSNILLCNFIIVSQFTTDFKYLATGIRSVQVCGVPAAWSTTHYTSTCTQLALAEERLKHRIQSKAKWIVQQKSLWNFECMGPPRGHPQNDTKSITIKSNSDKRIWIKNVGIEAPLIEFLGSIEFEFYFWPNRASWLFTCQLNDNCSNFRALDAHGMHTHDSLEMVIHATSEKENEVTIDW